MVSILDLGVERLAIKCKPVERKQLAARMELCTQVHHHLLQLGSACEEAAPDRPVVVVSVGKHVWIIWCVLAVFEICAVAKDSLDVFVWC